MRAYVAAEKGEENDDIPDEPERLHFEINYVIRTWLEHKLHHTYPELGGYNDQDPWLMEDWHTLNMFYARVSKGVFSALPLSSDAGDWLDLMGG